MADVLSLTLSIRQGLGSRQGEYWAEWQDVTPGSLAHVSAGKWCATEAKACDWLVSEVAYRMGEG